MTKLHEGLEALGVSKKNNEGFYADAQATQDQFSILERFPAPSSLKDMNPSGASQSISIKTSEFTSLCPITGQPDFATIHIEYTPDKWCVESKALKLYLLSFRNKGEFHEACVNRICNDLAKLMDPIYVRVFGEFTPRGGIPIHPTSQCWKSNPKKFVVDEDLADQS